jgi:hypothetical protein
MTTQILISDNGPATAQRMPFERRLRQIMVSQDGRRERVLEERRRAHRGHAGQLLRSHEHMARVERAAADLMSDLGSVLSIPLRLSRRLFDGRYALTVQLDETRADTAGAARRACSRVSFLMQPLPEEGRFRLECRATVHDRELESTATESELSSDDMPSIRAYMERQLLAFAERYCAGDGRDRAKVGSDVSWMEAAFASVLSEEETVAVLRMAD